MDIITIGLILAIVTFGLITAAFYAIYKLAVIVENHLELNCREVGRVDGELILLTKWQRLHDSIHAQRPMPKARKEVIIERVDD